MSGPFRSTAVLLLLSGATPVAQQEVDSGEELLLPPFSVSYKVSARTDEIHPPDPEPAADRVARLKERVAAGDESTDTRLALADALRDAGDPTAANALLDDWNGRLAEARARTPDDLGIALDYGRALFARGWDDQAVPQLSRVLQANPTEWRAAVVFAEILVDALYPGQARSRRRGLGSDMSTDSFMSSDSLASADAWLVASASAAPSSDAALLWLALGMIRFPVVSPSDADAWAAGVTSCLERAARLVPHCASARAIAAFARMCPIMMKLDTEAGSALFAEDSVKLSVEIQQLVTDVEADMLDLLAVTPGCADANGVLVMIDLLRGDTARALDHARAALEARTGATSQPMELVFARAFKRERWAECEKVGAILTAAADTARTHCLLGKLAGARGDLAGAERSYQVASERDPGCSDAWLGLALVARAQGRESAVIEARLAHVAATGNRTAAPEVAKASRALLRELEAGGVEPSDSRAAASRLLDCGRLYALLEQPDVAIARLRSAADVADAAQDAVVGWQARAALADAYHDLRLWPQARAAAEDASRLMSNQGTNRQIADVLLRLADVCTHEARDDEAIRNYERALALLPDAASPERQEVALTLAYSCLQIGQHERCESTCRELLERGALRSDGDAAAEARCLVALCEAQRIGLREASGCLARALAESERLGDARITFYVLSKMTDAALDRGDVGEAVLWLERLGSLTTSSIDRAVVLVIRAFETSRGGDPALALTALEEAAAAITTTPDRALAEGVRIDVRRHWAYVSRLASWLACAELAGDHAVDPARAFALVESVTARTLLEGLQERLDGTKSEVDASLHAKRDALLGQLEQIRVRAGSETPTTDTTKNAIEQNQSELDALDQQARATSGRLAELSVPPLVELRQLQQRLAPDEAVLVFLPWNPDSFAWVIRREAVTVRRLTGDDELTPDATDLVHALSTADAPPRAFVAPARRLYQRLLEPLLPLLDGATRLIVIPDGALAFVPFDVLLTADPPAADTPVNQLPFLLRERTVRFAPSCSVLLATDTASQPPRPTRKDVLLVADALYGDEDPARVPGDEAFGSRSRGGVNIERRHRLRGTREEVRAIAETLVSDDEGPVFVALRDLPRSGAVHARRFDLLVGADANENALQRDLRDYRVVHLAVHGSFDPEYPQFSGVVLSPGTGENCTGFVNLIELSLLEFDADVVFLSACETARGKLAAAEGPRSAVRSLLLAGARSVIGTMWVVRDDAAVAIATAFYASLFQGGRSAEEALRNAKLTALDHHLVTRGAKPIEPSGPRIDDGYAHPHYWAPYVLWGGALTPHR